MDKMDDVGVNLIMGNVYMHRVKERNKDFIHIG